MARQHEKEKAMEISEENRPVYHLTPYAGWMNDPNGFSYYNGKYHLFYQYYPYDVTWGPMYWGHAVSEDLVHWEHLPAALAPDRTYDEEGCWSGSAIEMPDGRHLIIYTGREPFLNDGKPEIRQVQCLAFGDGVDYEKWEKNPVIRSGDLPEGASIYDFRDPKIWKDEETGLYHIVVGSRAADGHGQVLLYDSVDGVSWEYKGVLDSSHGEIGSMWECPDFFELDGEAFILLSPQAMKQEGEFLNYHGNAYIKGSYDKKTRTFTRSEVHAMDFGYDYYAETSMEAPDGRRIVIAWMQAWENVVNQNEYLSKERPLGWAGMMTIPRELSVRDGYLIQNPVKEIETRRRRPVRCQNIPVSGRIRQAGINGRSLDMTIEVKPGWDSDYELFEIRLAEGEINGQYYAVILRYDRNEGEITLDRSVSGYPDDQMGVRHVKVGSDPVIKFRILLDRFSAEIFINDGRYSLSSVVLTPQEANGVSFISLGDAVMNVEKYEIV
jgi:beta-fructofuranosidase